jgi:hypothetical protein
VVDGESWNESLPGMYGNVRELLKSDEVGTDCAGLVMSCPET